MNNLQFQKFIKNLNKQIKTDAKDVRKLDREFKRLDREVKKNTQILSKINIKNSKKQAIAAKQLIKKNKNDMKKFIKSIPLLNKYERLLKQQEKDFKKKYGDLYKKFNITLHIYVEKKLDKKIYNYKNSNIIQRDSFEQTIYITAKIFNLIVPKKSFSRYLVNKFYNDIDDGILIIDDMLNEIKLINPEAGDIIDTINISDTIVGFKITKKYSFNKKYTVPIFNEQNLYNDATCKAIMSKYTKYKININSLDFKDLLQFDYCDYIQENFRENSCLLTAIINKFYKRFNVIKSDGKREYKELTYSYLCSLLDIPDKPSHNGTNINNVVEKFFKRFNFTGLHVYNNYNSIIYKHEPAACAYNHAVVLRIILHNKHVYEMNDNIKSLQQINYDDDDRKNLKTSNKYFIRDNLNDSVDVFCYEIEEIYNSIKINALNDNIIQLKIIVAIDMKTVLFSLMDIGYSSPKISISGTTLSKISIKLNKLLISITPASNNDCEGQLVRLYSLEEYNAYTNAYNKFYKSILKKEYLSDIHPSVKIIEDEYKIKPLTGYFDIYQNKAFDVLDERRAYTECLQSITQIPIFNYFDVYKPYDNEEIKNLNYYIIEVLDNTTEASILFDSKYSRSFGYVLNTIEIKYKILYYRESLNIEDVNFTQAVDELYKDETISDECKKAIANINIGLLGKKSNTNSLSKIFLDYNEANYYAIKYNGKLTPIHDDDMLSKHIRTNKDANKIVYAVEIVENKALINGFMPINDMIYINQRLKLLKQYQKMKKLNIKMVGIKTDCILYEGHHDDIIKQNFKLTKRIGDYKIEKHKYVVNKHIHIFLNELVNIQKYDVVPKIFDNEFDTVTINEYISSNKQKPLLIKGNYPGVGKSQLCKNYDSNCLFVCPYNKLCQVTRTDGIDSITYSKLFGLISTDIEMINVKRYDISKYNTIVFDEIFLYEPARLKRISELMESNKDKIFMATGDVDQRDAISFKNSEYIKHCMNLLFQNQILLNDIKRFKNVDDKIKLILLKNDILNTNMSVKDICVKHGINMITEMKDVKTTTNIALFNFRCTLINNHIHKNVLKQTKNYYDGLDIICKKYERSKNFVINTNFTYKIIKFGEKYIKIKDEVENIDYTIPMSILINNFKLPYALTLDSVQGLSFKEDEKITIFDSNIPYTDRKYFWTAITRARKLENVSVFIHSDEEVQKLTHSRIKLHFNNLISLYKIQDKKNNKEFISSDYINIEWIQMNIEKNKNNINIYIDDNAVVHSNVYINRIEQSKAYTINNSQFIFKK